jgi:hypothetical protein
MRLVAQGVISAILLLVSPDAFACDHDRDCPAASRCVKVIFGETRGVCKRGVTPVEGEEKRSPYGENPNRPKRGVGDACQFHAECAEGLQCLIQPDGSGQVCSY